MDPRRRSAGTAFLAAVFLLLAVLGFLAAIEVSAAGAAAERDRISDRALATAREALIAYAVDHAINSVVGPGYLPCPDLDDDGWAESTCGSMNGDLGQDERLGRLPWKTLGLDDLRDGYGERLWYAVSTKYKGLLNCGASRACLDMSPGAALGTITVRDAAGRVLHDGTLADPLRAAEGGALAVILAPGPALARFEPSGERAWQARACAPGECDAAGRCLTDPPQRAARCDPRRYLDLAPGSAGAGEDNADFIDRLDAAGRPRNANGFVMGPVRASDGSLAVNDRLAVIGYDDLMPALMRRVALEVAHCLRAYAAQPANTGRYPWPAPLCRQSLPDAGIAWSGANGAFFGRIPSTPFAEARSASAGRMLELWWSNAPGPLVETTRLPTRANACRIAIPPDEDGAVRTSPPGTPPEEGRTAGLAENAWWTFWKPYVFYALAHDFAPASMPQPPACTTPGGCLTVASAEGRTIASGREFAVIVAGAELAPAGSAQDRRASGAADARQWLEGANAELARGNPNPPAASCPPDPLHAPCAPDECTRVVSAPRSRTFNDVAVVHP